MISPNKLQSIFVYPDFTNPDIFGTWGINLGKISAINLPSLYKVFVNPDIHHPEKNPGKISAIYLPSLFNVLVNRKILTLNTS